MLRNTIATMNKPEPVLGEPEPPRGGFIVLMYSTSEAVALYRPLMPPHVLKLVTMLCVAVLITSLSLCVVELNIIVWVALRVTSMSLWVSEERMMLCDAVRRASISLDASPTHVKLCVAPRMYSEDLVTALPHANDCVAVRSYSPNEGGVRVTAKAGFMAMSDDTVASISPVAPEPAQIIERIVVQKSEVVEPASSSSTP